MLPYTVRQFNVKKFSFSSHGFLFVTILCLATANSTVAQVSIPADEFEYFQDFNSLSKSTSDNNFTLPGWYAIRQYGVTEFTPPAFVSVYRGNDGGSTTFRLYSYGTEGDNERALGTINQDDSGDVIYGVLFQNNSGVDINSIVFSVRVEQWRRPQTDYKSHQRIKVSYAVETPMNLTLPHLLDSSNFMEIPEINLFTRDTSSMDPSIKLIGNLPVASGNVSGVFPVTIPNGAQFFLRFHDDNASGLDAALAIDDLHVKFRSATTPRIVGTSDFSIFPYLDMGMVEDIPDVDGKQPYIVPTDLHMQDWQEILTNFFQSNWSAVDLGAAPYGYVLTNYNANGQSYYILRKTIESPYFWGTYVKAVSPVNSKLVLTSPHPIDDQFTGRQSAALFHLTGAGNLFIAGAGRCVSGDFSPCVGGTKTCSLETPREEEDYRMSDPAHTTKSIFHLATTALAELDLSTVFFQLHGFSDDHTKDFYISCGTMDGYQKNVPDYSVSIREHLKLFAPVWDLQIPHVDHQEELGARDNPQGRFLNLYTPVNNFCENETDPVTVTNRFLHIEQYNGFRRSPRYYPLMATALSSTINNDQYVRQIRITDADNDYTQDFDELPAGQNGEPIHTWGNNLHLPGWYAVKSTFGLFSNYIVDNGAASTGGLFSFGQNGTTDRALGSLNGVDANGDQTGRIAYGMLFRNDTGETIYGVDLSYDAEQWRKVNGQIQNVKLSFATGSIIDISSNGLLNDPLFTNVPDGNLLSTQSVGNGAVDGNVSYSTISNLSIPVILNDGEEIFIRFVDEDTGGAGTNDVAMALDNVTVSFSTMSTPVTWRSFEALRSGRQALLKWSADAENQCDRYEVQRSVDGTSFELITSISCQNLPGTNHYEFRDVPPSLAPIVYYRICQYDFDGSLTCSQVRAFKQKILNAPVVFYENGSLVIHTRQENKPVHISLLNTIGKDLASGSPLNDGVNQYRMDCTLPGNQLIIVRIKFDDGTTQAARIHINQ